MPVEVVLLNKVTTAPGNGSASTHPSFVVEVTETNPLFARVTPVESLVPATLVPARVCPTTSALLWSLLYAPPLGRHC
jgi:hypothetical protein